MLLYARLSTKFLAAVLLVCALGAILRPSEAKAQVFTTGNAFVAADVSKDGFGQIAVYTPTAPKSFLSYEFFSYVTFNVNGLYYTNNNQGNPPTVPAPPYALLTGGKTTQIKDTIRTVWSPSPNFDLIQDVYPVLFPINGSGQIVYKWSAVNHINAPLNIQVQYLNDVELSSRTLTNDNPNITTRYGYVKTNTGQNAQGWVTFTGSGIPPFYVTTQKDLCASGFPGTVGVGYNNDSLAGGPMGLMQPQEVDIVDWPTIVTKFTWGNANQSTINITPIGDDALLLIWPPNAVAKNDTVVIGCGSYGTGPCAVTYGNLTAMMFHPEYIKWTAQKVYNPDPFQVEALVFNSNASGSGSNAKATQVTTGPVHIMAPGPVSAPYQSQTQTMSPPTIGSCGVSDAYWTDWVDSSLFNCSTYQDFDIWVNISAGGLQTPYFIDPESGNASNGFRCKVRVDCQQKDVVPPKHSTHIASNPTSCGTFRTYTWNVYDSSATDLGLHNITWTTDPNVTVQLSVPNFATCPRIVQVTATQKDTSKAACINFTYQDCATPANVSFDTACFAACAPPNHVDTIAPKFWLVLKSDTNHPVEDTNCSFKTSVWHVTDSINKGLQTDRGVDSLLVDSSDNMYMDSVIGLAKGAAQVGFRIGTTDTMSPGYIRIKSVDDAGHITYLIVRYCPDPDSLPPIITASPLNQGDWTDDVTEFRAWDRGIDSIRLFNVVNCAPVPQSGYKMTQLDSKTWSIKKDPKLCVLEIKFDVSITDTFQTACFQAEAWDCAGNHVVGSPQCSSPLFDSFCPKDVVVTSTAPHGVTVTINDNAVNYDTGIDSVWFTYSHNMRFISTTGRATGGNPPTIFGRFKGMAGKDSTFDQSLSFTFEVADSLVEDTLPACIYWNAIDGAGNYLCGTTQWCYNLIQDVNPPAVTVTNPQCTQLSLYVTDSLITDRGIYKVWLDTAHNVNFQPMDRSNVNQPRLGIVLQKVAEGKSATAKLSAMDIYGSLGTGTIPRMHTDSVNLWMYSQDLSMNATKIFDRSAPNSFVVPVYLAPTDPIPLSKKNIYQYQFTFHLTGSTTVDFAGVDVTGTSSSGWNITPVPGVPITPSPSRYYTITAFGPALSDADLSATKPLINLLFKGGASDVVQVTELVVDTDQCRAAVVYNGGNDTTFSGPNYSVTLPAPNGMLNGGTIILKGTCTPEIGTGNVPSVVSLAPTVPNPTMNSTTVVYTIPAEGMVTLDLFDALGAKAKTLVSEVEKQGKYEIQMETEGLPEGTYFLRLSSGGKVVSRRIVLAH